MARIENNWSCPSFLAYSLPIQVCSKVYWSFTFWFRKFTEDINRPPNVHYCCINISTSLINTCHFVFINEFLFLSLNNKRLRWQEVHVFVSWARKLVILISVFRYLTKIFSQKKLRIQGRVWLEDFNLNTFILAKGIGTKGTCTKQCSDLDLVQGQFKPLPISILWITSARLGWEERATNK